jgi:hypothetical protein
MGGEVLLHYWHLGAARQRLPFWGLFLEAREDIPNNNVWRRQQDHKSGCGEKLRETKNN